MIKNDLHDIWLLDSLANIDINPKNFALGAPTMELRPQDSTILGFSGCNNYRGKMWSDGKNKITISRLITTKRGCPNIKENEFLKTLELVDNYERIELFLYLKKENETLLIFKKVD